MVFLKKFLIPDYTGLSVQKRCFFYFFEPDGLLKTFSTSKLRLKNEKMIIIIVSIIDSSKSALTIFLKLMFTIDIRKSVTGQDFSKKMIFIRTMGENPHFLMFFAHISNDFSETLHDFYNRY